MEARYFQWVAGEQRGQVQFFDKIEADGPDVYILFKDGGRINESLVASLNQKDLTGKLMAEIDHPNNCWQFNETWVGREEERHEMDSEGVLQLVVPFNPGKKVVKLIPPRHSAPRASNFGQISNPAPVQEVIQPIDNKSKIDKSDPVYILMSKAKKLDSEINMGMIISLPPKNLYELARDSFEEGDEKFIRYIVDELTVEEIKEALRLAVKEMYEGVTE
jgi:hypothetical protein